jgi:hypothetical protein
MINKQAQKAIIVHIRGNQSKDVTLYKVDDINDASSNWYIGSVIQKFSISQKSGEVFPVISFETCSLNGFVKISDIAKNDIDLSDGVIICAHERDNEKTFCFAAQLLICKSRNKRVVGKKFSDSIEMFGAIMSVDFSTDCYNNPNKFDMEIVHGFYEEEPVWVELFKSVGCNVISKGSDYEK